MITNYLIIFLLSLILGLFLNKTLINLSLRYDFLNIKNIPHVGGVSMGISYLVISVILCYFFNNARPVILGILIPSTVMFLFGIIDDKKEFSIKQKLFTQLICAFLFIYLGIKTNIVYIGNIANIFVSLIWIIGITNAFNHLDILDGLAAGAAAIIGMGLFIHSVVVQNNVIACLTIAIVGILLSFLSRNCPPAKIYMGNSGSHFIGFVFAGISLAMSFASIEHKIALVSPVFILGFPIFDTAFVIIMRLKKKRSILVKSDDHFALRLIKAGCSKTRALIFSLLIALFFTTLGFLISIFDHGAAYFLILLICLVSWVVTLRVSQIEVAS